MGPHMNSDVSSTLIAVSSGNCPLNINSFIGGKGVMYAQEGSLTLQAYRLGPMKWII